jgi:putative SOS response-associated peptidase YedK
MPVILSSQDYDLWLRRNSREQTALPSPPLELLALLRPYPAEGMRAPEAHKDVGNVRNNHPGLLNSA